MFEFFTTAKTIAIGSSVCKRIKHEGNDQAYAMADEQSKCNLYNTRKSTEFDEMPVTQSNVCKRSRCVLCLGCLCMVNGIRTSALPAINGSR